MKKFEETTMSSESIFKGRIISLRVDEVLLPNENYAKREIIDHRGAVAVIPITKEGKIVLVKQFRKALERTIIEIPAGGIEEGEEFEHTARRELEEETGYQAEEWTFLQAFATSPGFANEIIHIFLAEGLEKIDNPADGDEDEFIEILEVTLEEAEKFVRSGEIYDAKTAWAILYLKSINNQNR